MTNKAVEENTIDWWEKSVEYAFIAKMVNLNSFVCAVPEKVDHNVVDHNGSVWAVPLAGGPETALGDAIIHWEGDLLLIEFKRDGTNKSFKSEHEKYAKKKNATVEVAKKAFEAAKKAMITHEGAKKHGLIYGKENKGELVLDAIPYWVNCISDNGITNPREAMEWCALTSEKCDGEKIKEIENYKERCKVLKENFHDYLEKLSRLRIWTSKKSEESRDDSSDSSGSSGSSSFVVGIGRGGKTFSMELENYKKLQLDYEYKKKLEYEKLLKNTPSTIKGSKI